jgi:opacity protein-like surface antigen
VAVNVHKYFAAESEVTGYYRSNLLGNGVNVWDYGFAAGPRFNFRRIFLHALLGADYLTGSASSLSASQSSFATTIGGGVQMRVAPRYYLRVSTDWVRTGHNFGNAAGSSLDQNNFRASVGLMYSFGQVIRGEASPAEDTPKDQAPPRRSGCGVLWNCMGSTQ